MKTSNLLLALLTLVVLNCQEDTSTKDIAILDDSISNTEIETNDIIERELIPEKDRIDSLYFHVGARFEAIKKSKIDNINLVNDFLTTQDQFSKNPIVSSELILMVNNERTNTRAYGNGNTLSESQKAVLKSLKHSDGFITAITRKESNGLKRTFTPHYTVVPETTAVFKEGNKAELRELNNAVAEFIPFIDKAKLKFTKFYFTVDKNGAIKNTYFDWSTNYPELDKKIFELIKTYNQKWTPAKDKNGEVVEQEIVITVGLVGAC